MKRISYIVSLCAAVCFTACTDCVESSGYIVNNAKNAIVLGAGVKEGGSGLQTRAAEDNHDADNTYGGGHKTLTPNTKLRLRVDGTWLGKANDYALPHGKVTSQIASQTTTASVGNEIKVGEEQNETHNEVTFLDNEKLYWDDYGTADPANMNPVDGNGRDKGLTIYGVALDTINIAAPEPTEWKSLPWTLASNQSTGWGAWDLLTSNNIRPTTDGGDGTLVFDHTKTGSSTTPSNLLEFTHAMSKITVELTAGEGFNGWSTETPNAGKFTGAPSVTLKDFKYKGIVNIESKTSTPDDGDDAKSDIKMHLTDGGASNHTATFDAIVFPGNKFADNKEILTLTADGNTFKVTAEELNNAIKAAIGNASTLYPATGTDTSLKQGWNYKILITVDKTKIHIQATVVNWNEVTADPVYPKISVTESYGIELGDGTGKEPAFEKDFDFFVSEKIGSEYAWKAYITHETENGKHTYTMHDQLYWPNHQIHYFFRGVWPRVGTADQTDINQNYTTKTNVDDKDIDVKNVAYTANTYPSDLMIGYPRVNADKTCPHGNKVEEKGICATEGDIIMNFRYVMSQVEVHLESATGNAAVNIDEKTLVELVNVYNTGNAILSDGSVTLTGEPSTYRLNNVTGDDKKLFRHSAIVPQPLTYSTPQAETNLRFKITVTNDDAVLYADVAEYNAAKGTTLDNEAFAALTTADKTKTPATTDVYYADVNPILKSGSTTEKVAPNDKWESGKHYIYTLTLSKTEIKVTATITDWKEVKASQNIWF